MDTAPPLFHPEHATVGELIAALRECGPERRVAFDFCGRVPNGIHPYGRVGQGLAFGHAEMIEEQWPTVKRLMDALYGAIHQTFHRPDEEFTFRASHDTPLWVANSVELTGTVIVGLYNREHGVFIRTDHWGVA